MLTGKDLNEEIRKIEDVITNEKDAVKQAMLKSQVLILKLLVSLRANTVAVMRYFKIPLVKPRGGDRVEKKSQEKGE